MPNVTFRFQFFWGPAQDLVGNTATLQLLLPPGLSFTSDSGVFLSQVHQPVQIDIEPSTFPNSINLSAAGVIPVAILSTAMFDAIQINPSTVTLGGANVEVIGRGDKYSCRAEDVIGDNLIDLVCHIVTAGLVVEVGDSIAILEAQTFSGEEIGGEDSIRIVP